MKQRLELPQVDEVKLPTLFSLRPGIYILAILIILIGMTIFFVAFYPGIVKGGRYVTFTSPISESGIYSNESYIGPAGYQHFLESGEHAITVKKAGIVLASYQLTVDHPVFLTRLFHRTLVSPVPSLSLNEHQQMEIIRFNLDEIAKQSAILVFDDVTRYQPLFSNLVQDINALELPLETAQKSLELALLYVSSSTMAEDAIQALQGQTSLLSQEVLQNLSLVKKLFESTGSINQKSGMHEESLNMRTLEKTSLSYNEINITGYRYPSTNFVMGTETELQYPQVISSGVTVDVPSFTLASLPISQYQWALFVEENPYWDKNNKTALMIEGLVDNQYLEGLAISTVFVTNRPVFNISYHAALAFTQWLSEKSGKHVVIPTEAMWSLAAQSRNSTTYDSSMTAAPSTREEPLALLGGVWEFTQTPFIPLSRLNDYTRAIALHQEFGLQTQPIVKGGSYLNNPNSITAFTVGVVDPDVCGDQIGFRIAWYD